MRECVGWQDRPRANDRPRTGPEAGMAERAVPRQIGTQELVSA